MWLGMIDHRILYRFQMTIFLWRGFTLSISWKEWSLHSLGILLRRDSYSPGKAWSFFDSSVSVQEFQRRVQLDFLRSYLCFTYLLKNLICFSEAYHLTLSILLHTETGYTFKCLGSLHRKLFGFSVQWPFISINNQILSLLSLLKISAKQITTNLVA